jgi:hypothetical protein
MMPGGCRELVQEAISNPERCSGESEQQGFYTTEADNAAAGSTERDRVAQSPRRIAARASSGNHSRNSAMVAPEPPSAGGAG